MIKLIKYIGLFCFLSLFFASFAHWVKVKSKPNAAIVKKLCVGKDGKLRINLVLN